jgi:hypothetical protein
MLNAEQIGKLAKHIEQSIRDHKDEPDERMGMHEWEWSLQGLVTNDPDLPDYVDMHDEILEALIGHFAKVYGGKDA